MHRPDPSSPAAMAERVRAALPPGGLFAGQTWRTAPVPFALGETLARDLESLGRVLLQFYRAVNLLHRHSREGRQPAWVAELMDRGKPESLLALQHAPAFKQALPRVIRPDILLTEEGFSITELDSVPGGIGLTACLNQAYAETGVIGGPRGMLGGFAGLFGDAARVHLVVSEESATYRPEMAWLARQLGEDRFAVRDASFNGFAPGDAVYRFFELFDLANIPAWETIASLASAGAIRLTPPPKPLFEEKLLFALLHNRNLREFWRQQLGEGFFLRLTRHVPYSWAVDPTPLPPHAVYPGLELADWRELKALSQREREIILKVSGFHPQAWGARGVALGSDLSQADWSAAVDRALAEAGTSPRVLQRYHKPRVVEAHWYDFERHDLVAMPGRVRLCPYYFVHGEGTAARTHLGGVLATICPADKKIIHGMTEAILAPCRA